MLCFQTQSFPGAKLEKSTLSTHAGEEKPILPLSSSSTSISWQSAGGGGNLTLNREGCHRVSNVPRALVHVTLTSPKIGQISLELVPTDRLERGHEAMGGPWYPVAGGRRLGSSCGNGGQWAEGREISSQETGRESGAERCKKAERESCKGKSETSTQRRTGGKLLSERKPSGNVRWDVGARASG